MWLTGGRRAWVEGLVISGGDLAMLAAPAASVVYECGDSSESTGDIVTELSERTPVLAVVAALLPLVLAVTVAMLPLDAANPVASPPAGFFLRFAFISFRSLTPPPAPLGPPSLVAPPPRRFFLFCCPGRMPITPLLVQTMEGCPPPPFPTWFDPECGLCTRLYWSSRRTMS